MRRASVAAQEEEALWTKVYKHFYFVNKIPRNCPNHHFRCVNYFLTSKDEDCDKLRKLLNPIDLKDKLSFHTNEDAEERNFYFEICWRFLSLVAGYTFRELRTLARVCKPTKEQKQHGMQWDNWTLLLLIENIIAIGNGHPNLNIGLRYDPEPGSRLLTKTKRWNVMLVKNGLTNRLFEMQRYFNVMYAQRADIHEIKRTSLFNRMVNMDQWKDKAAELGGLDTSKLTTVYLSDKKVERQRGEALVNMVDDQCSICIGNLRHDTEEKEIAVTTCGHCFHFDCLNMASDHTENKNISAVMRNQNPPTPLKLHTCPNCRTSQDVPALCYIVPPKNTELKGPIKLVQKSIF